MPRCLHADEPPAASMSAKKVTVTLMGSDVDRGCIDFARVI